MSGRRLRNGLIVALCVFLGSGAALAKEDRLPPPEKGGNDLYQQDWFLETFLNLPDDLEEAVAVGTEANQIVAASVSGALAQWRRRLHVQREQRP